MPRNAFKNTPISHEGIEQEKTNKGKSKVKQLKTTMDREALWFWISATMDGQQFLNSFMTNPQSQAVCPSEQAAPQHHTPASVKTSQGVMTTWEIIKLFYLRWKFRTYLSFTYKQC